MKQKDSPLHSFLGRAYHLAKKGQGFTSPNPCVGAVIVKNGAVIGEGYHKRAGQPHAEVEAVNDALKRGFELVGAEMYVTLEPCCHFGKTPPCTDLIVKHGIRKVYIGMQDPFEKVNGGGAKKLVDSGVEVEFCDFAPVFVLLNQPFIKMMETGLPYVVLKAGMSLDGKIATASGESKWITGERARGDARLERSMCDAVLVGSGTVEKDDCELAAHGKFAKKNLLRVILDKRLELPLDAKVFRDKNVFVATTDLASKENRERFMNAGVEFESFGKERVDFEKLFKYLGTKGILSVFVEGGAKVHGALVDAAAKNTLLIDRVLFYVAPLLLGGDGVNVLGGNGPKTLGEAFKFHFNPPEGLGEDLKITAFVNFYGEI